MSAAPPKTTAAWRVLDGFGGSMRSLSSSVSPATVEEMAAVFAAARAEGLNVSFRGAGRSYGDASLNTGGLAVDGRAMRRILSFDRERGVIERSEEHTSELQSLRHLVCRL